MKKIYKITPLTTAIILTAIGLARILLPYSVVGVALRIIGALLLGLEIYRALPLLGSRETLSALLVFVLSDIFVIVFSLVLLIDPIGAVNTLCIILGIYLIVSAGIELYKLSRLAFIGIRVYVMPIITLLFGVFLVFYPSSATKLTFILIGIAILIKAVDLFIYELSGKGKSNASRTKRKHIVSNDYKDISGK